MTFSAGVIVTVGGLVLMSTALAWLLLPQQPTTSALLAWRTARGLTVTAVTWTVATWLADSYVACAVCLLAALAAGRRTQSLRRGAVEEVTCAGDKGVVD